MLGSNGAGKTTTIRAASGLLGVHGGRVVAGDVQFTADVHRHASAPVVGRGMAQVSEGRMVFKHLTVEENLRVGAAAAGTPAAQGAREVYERFPSFRDSKGQKAGWMSGGEQQWSKSGAP